MRTHPSTSPAPPSTAYLRAALAFLVPGGSLVGVVMILQLAGLLPAMAWPAHLRAHGHMQVFGFVVLFTMGIALLVVPRLTGAPAPPREVSRVPLALVAPGVLAAVAGWPRAASILETAGALAFLVAVRLSARRPAGPRSPVARWHTLYATSGGLWLVAGAASGIVPVPSPWPLDTVLLGFASTYIMAVGLLIHPRILGLPEPAGGPVLLGLGLWNAGLAARVAALALPVPGWLSPALLAGGALAYLAGLGPFRRSTPSHHAPPWLPVFLRTSYAWLVLAMLGGLAAALAGSPPWLSGPWRHALAAGFVLTMMVGMAFRIVPNFLGLRLAWAAAPRVAWLLLTVGTAVRVVSQALLPAAKPTLALGGLLQFAAVLVFGLTLWVTMGRPAAPEAPPGPVSPPPA